MIELPDGVLVRGRGLRHPTPPGPAPDAGLYLGSDRWRRKHDASLTWQHEWIRWPDFLLPADRQAAASAIVRLHDLARSELSVASGVDRPFVEVACGGGVGRTGTVLACMATLSGLGPHEAIAWTRAHHHRRAVETPWQGRWVVWFATRDLGWADERR